MAKVAFWHKPDKRIDKHQRWHAYNQRGSSLCGKFALLGIGKPKDASKAPGGNRCQACLRARDR